MEHALKNDAMLALDDDYVVQLALAMAAEASSRWICRICHEEEDERFTTMESPCSCSGTVKFAHRECIQKWCDEKGSNVCEICLQKYEPGYTVPEKKALADVAVTIRDSLEVPRLGYDSPRDHIIYANYAECNSATHRSANLCRYVAIIFTVLLLIRDILVLVTGGTENFAFTVLTLFLLRASGILLPFYLVMRFISAVQEAQHQNYIP